MNAAGTCWQLDKKAAQLLKSASKCCIVGIMYMHTSHSSSWQTRWMPQLHIPAECAAEACGKYGSTSWLGSVSTYMILVGERLHPATDMLSLESASKYASALHGWPLKKKPTKGCFALTYAPRHCRSEAASDCMRRMHHQCLLQ